MVVLLSGRKVLADSSSADPDGRIFLPSALHALALLARFPAEKWRKSSQSGRFDSCRLQERLLGIDVHKRDSHVRIVGEGGEVVLEQLVRTHRERLGSSCASARRPGCY